VTKAHGTGWCWMCSTLLQILLIFSSPEGYWLQFSIPGPHFMYTVWHCTSQHCSSMYVCTYRLLTHGAPWWVLSQLSIVAISFSSLSVVSRAFSALCVYSPFGHHPHPLGYLCAKFRYFRGLHCWASPWRKISIYHSPILHAESLTQSLTQLIWCPGNWSFGM